MATAFPFDPSGTSSANRITNEQHVITAQNFRDYHYVIPNFAPFFERDFTIKLQYPNGNVRNLTLGVDYYFSNQFLDASRACAKPVYGSISFLDTDTAGILSISYNTVGGMWNITPQEITRILAEEMRNPRITSWEQITYLPERFPVIDHEWDLVDMVGETELVAAIENVAAAVLAANGGGLNEHVNNYSNPHNVTKSQVGLGNVLNYPVATIAEAQAGTSNGQYMTPLRTKDAINNLGGALVSAHADRTDNPHTVTKAQVGLGSVDNYATASQTEAETGSSTTKFMTPLRTAQAITAQVGTAFNTHAANQMNPHNVTKDQVGLFNVQNYPVATAEEARTGSASDRYMTPQRTTQLVTEFITVVLDGHAARTDNPHETTKAHVGLSNVPNYALATISEAEAGVSNTTLMSPGRTADAIRIMATPVSHLSDLNNPHGVTKSQVDLGNVQNYPIASQLEAQEGTSNVKYMTPLRTTELLTQFVTVALDGHATRTDNPHATTKAQVGLGSVQNYGIATLSEAQAGATTDKYMTPQRTAQAISALAAPASHLADKNNPHAVTALQVGAYSQTEVDLILTGYVKRTDQWVAGMTKEAFIVETRSGTASNASKLEGKTLAEVVALVQDGGTGLFAQTSSIFSRDTDVTPDPVANPYRWIKIGEVTQLTSTDTMSLDTLDLSYPDAYWFFAGGHKQESDALANAASTSPGYLIHAKNGMNDSRHSFDVTRLNGPSDSDVQFGYTFDAGTGIMSVWAKVACGHNDVSITGLTSLANTTALTDDGVVAEPAGITYATPVSYATTTDVSAALSTANQRLTVAFSTVNQRLTDLETVINSISVV